METDILIAVSMVLASIAALLGIIVKVGRAVREEPRPKIREAAAPQPMTALRSASGW